MNMNAMIAYHRNRISSVILLKRGRLRSNISSNCISNSCNRCRGGYTRAFYYLNRRRRQSLLLLSSPPPCSAALSTSLSATSARIDDHAMNFPPTISSSSSSFSFRTCAAAVATLAAAGAGIASMDTPLNRNRGENEDQGDTDTTIASSSAAAAKSLPQPSFSAFGGLPPWLSPRIRIMMPSSMSIVLETTPTTHCESASTTTASYPPPQLQPQGGQSPKYTSSTPAPTTRNPTTTTTTNKTTPNTHARNVMIQTRRSVSGRELDDKYIVDWKTVLGEGAYGSVHPARLRATGEKVALKKISRRYTNSLNFKTETDALLRIYDSGGHPNISGLRDMYEDHHSFYLILDLVTGGELFTHLSEYGAYSEADAARLTHEIASALAFMHGVGVIHADIKPENLLLSTKNRLNGTIKIIDFGAAVVLPVEEDPSERKVGGLFGLGGNGHKKKMLKVKTAASTGTTAYWSPERFEKGILATPAMDMWSIGVVLYIMLTGCHPFDVNGTFTDAETEAQIRKDPHPPLHESLVGHLSDSAIDLIVRLMEEDPAKRLTAYEMLQHPWVRGETALTEKIPYSDTKLSRFKDLRYKLEAGMFAVMVSQSNQDARLSEARTSKKKKLSERRSDASADILVRAFQAFDAEGKGFVTADDLGRVTNERLGSTISSVDTKEFLETQSNDGVASTSALSLSQFNKLFSGLRQKHFPRGHYIFHAGDKGEAMYFICSGKVEIQTRKGQLVSILRSGDFFGEGSLVETEKNSRFTTAKCATPVDVVEISRADLDRFLGSCPNTKNELRSKWRARTLTYAKNLLRLSKKVRDREYKKGDVVYSEGDIGNTMYRVRDVDGGELDVYHNNVVVHKYVEGDSFGESSLLFKRPRSSTVVCATDTCRLHLMKGRDFLEAIESSPELAASLRNMCRKRLFKKAVKQYSLDRTRGLTKDDIVAAFNDADVNQRGYLNLEEVRLLMNRMDPSYPLEEIRELLKFVDVDEDGMISLSEFKNLFRQFEEDADDDCD